MIYCPEVGILRDILTKLQVNLEIKLLKSSGEHLLNLKYETFLSFNNPSFFDQV